MFCPTGRTAILATLMLSLVPPVITESRAVAQAQSVNNTSTVLTSVNGRSLTQSMVNNTIAFGEFLADRKFTAADKRWLTDLAVKDFRKNPTEEIRGYKEVAKVLTQLKGIREPFQRAWARERLFSAIHFSLLEKQKSQEPSVMTVVYRYIPVLATDRSAKLMLTERAMQSILTSNDFAAKLAGQPQATPQFKAEFRQALIKRFPTLSPSLKQALATAESRWLRLQATWALTPAKTKKQVTSQVRQYVKQPVQVPEMARRLENAAETAANGGTASNTADLGSLAGTLAGMRGAMYGFQGDGMTSP